MRAASGQHRAANDDDDDEVDGVGVDLAMAPRDIGPTIIMAIVMGDSDGHGDGDHCHGAAPNQTLAFLSTARSSSQTPSQMGCDWGCRKASAH